MRKYAAGLAACSGAVGYGYYSILHKRSSVDYSDLEPITASNPVRNAWLQKLEGVLPNAMAEKIKSFRDPVYLLKCEDGTYFIPWQPPSRDEIKQRLRKEEYDILVIGGGATGSGVALDAQTRGLKTAVVEYDDFAAGTSSRSTKLIHGGIRYLAQAFQKKIPPNSILDLIMNFQYDHSKMEVVFHDLAERAYMMQSAPFMSKALPMMIPLHHWWEVPIYWTSGKMYDLIAGSRRSVPESHFISRAEALFRFPTLKSEGLIGAIVLYDGQQNDTRMNLYIALTAAQHGASVINHTEVLSLTTTGKLGTDSYKVTGAMVKDSISGEKYQIKAKQVINATGPFADSIRKMADPETSDIIVPAKGTHLIIPDHFSPDNMGCVWFTKDGRVLYLLPWEGSTIAGTTDVKEKASHNPLSSLAEVDFILGECNRTLSSTLNHSHVRASWAGLRPLVRNPNADPSDTKALARDHVVDITRGGLLSICGGKWTTYRKMAEDAVDRAIELNPDLKPERGCATPTMKLVGTDRGGLVCHQNFDKVVVTLREKYDMDKLVARHLMQNYGTRALMVADLAKEYAEAPRSDETGSSVRYLKLYSKYPILEAEVVFACRQEYAMTAVDVLARRTRLAFLDADAAEKALPKILQIMQRELGWSRWRKEQEKKEALEFLRTMSLPAK